MQLASNPDNFVECRRPQLVWELENTIGYCKFEGLTSNTRYIARLDVIYDNGEVAREERVKSAPEPPYSIEELALSSSVTIDWGNTWSPDDMVHFLHYDVSLTRAMFPEITLETKGVTSPTYTDRQLTPVEGYVFEIVGNFGGYGITDPLVVQNRTALPKPDLKIMEVRSTAVNITWLYQELIPQEYIVEVKLATSQESTGLEGDNLELIPGGYLLKLTRLEPDTEYNVTVVALMNTRPANPENPQPWKREERSDPAQITFRTSEKITPFIIDVRDYSATIKWDHVHGAEEYLLVYQPKSDDGNSTFFAGGNIIHLDKTQTQLTISPLEPYHEYRFKLR